MAITRVTLKDIKTMPPLTAKRIAELDAIRRRGIDTSEMQEATDEQLSSARRLVDIHPEWFEKTSYAERRYELNEELTDEEIADAVV